MKKIVLYICIAFILVACNNKEEKKAVLRPVLTTKPILQNSIQTRTFSGFAKSHKELKLSFKVKGNIQKLDLNIGDYVKKSQLIAKLDSKPYEIQVEQARYLYQEAIAQLKNATNSYERVKKLYINQNSTKSDFDNAKALYTSSTARVKQAKEKLSYTKLQLSYTKLYAPQNGIIALKLVEANENVNAGTPIVLLNDTLVKDISIEVPESFINKITLKQEASLEFDSLSKKYKAKVSEISKVATKGLKTYKVILQILNTDEKIKSGMVVDVNLKKNTNNNNIFLIPSVSVLSDINGYFVYVAKNSNKNEAIVKKVYVKLGELKDEGYEIIKGLNKDDLVIKAGMNQIYENMKVKIK